MFSADDSRRRTDRRPTGRTAGRKLPGLETLAAFGTGAFLLAQLGANAARSTSGLTTSVAWRLREHTSYCVDGQVYTAASAVRWAVDLGLGIHCESDRRCRSRFQ